jgi:hypothetical protein
VLLRLECQKLHGLFAQDFRVVSEPKAALKLISRLLWSEFMPTLRLGSMATCRHLVVRYFCYFLLSNEGQLDVARRPSEKFILNIPSIYYVMSLQCS